MPPEQMTIEWFASTYHFTEEQTLGLSLEALEWWPVISMARVEARELEQRRAERMQKNSQVKR